MKKTLAAILALITITSCALVACNEKEPSGGETPSGDNGGFELDLPPVNTDPDGTDDSSNTNDNTTPSDEFRAITAKSVYTMARVNLRSEPNLKSSSIVKAVDPATELTAIATNDDWYKVTYEGAERYIVAEYVTSDIKNTQFAELAADDTLKTLTIATAANGDSMQVKLREVPVIYDDVNFVTVDNEKVTDAKPLEIVKKNANGNWFIVKFEDKEYYVAINSSTKPCFNELKGTGGGAAGG